MVRHQPPNSWLMPRRTVTGKPRPLAGLHATPLVARSSSTDRYRRGISHLCRAILAPGDVVVMDNLGAQKIARIAQPIAAAEPGPAAMDNTVTYAANPALHELLSGL
jgi:hypothetical protein